MIYLCIDFLLRFSYLFIYFYNTVPRLKLSV